MQKKSSKTCFIQGFQKKNTFTILGRICFPSNRSSRHLDEDVSKNVKSQLQDLKEAAEGDAKPEREATSQGVEQAPILDKYSNSKVISANLSNLHAVVNLVLNGFLIQRSVVDIDHDQIL